MDSCNCPSDEETWPDYVIGGEDDAFLTSLYQDASHVYPFPKERQGHAITEWRLPSFSEYKRKWFKSKMEMDSYDILNFYVEFAQDWVSKLEQAVLLRDEHYVTFIFNRCMKEEKKHRNWRVTMRDEILPQSRAQFERLNRQLERQSDEIFDEPKYAKVPILLEPPALVTNTEWLKFKGKSNKQLAQEKKIREQKQKRQEAVSQETQSEKTLRKEIRHVDRLQISSVPEQLSTMDVSKEMFKDIFGAIIESNRQKNGVIDFTLQWMRYFLNFSVRQTLQIYKIFYHPIFAPPIASNEFLRHRLGDIALFDTQYADSRKSIQAFPIVAEMAIKLDNLPQWFENAFHALFLRQSLSGMYEYSELQHQLQLLQKKYTGDKHAQSNIKFLEIIAQDNFYGQRFKFASNVIKLQINKLQKLDHPEQFCEQFLQQDRRLAYFYNVLEDDVPKKLRKATKQNKKDKQEYELQRKKFNKLCKLTRVACTFCGESTLWKDKKSNLPVCGINCFRQMLKIKA